MSGLFNYLIVSKAATVTISKDDKIEYISENHNHDQYLPVNAEYIIMLSILKMITALEKLSIYVAEIKHNNIYNSLEKNIQEQK